MSSTPSILPTADAQWIWSDREMPSPVNRWTWFRTAFELTELPEDGTLEIAANSNARVYVNGACVLRKVTRFDERFVTSTTVRVLQHLNTGTNSIQVLHHNWGDIVTFQRTGNTHAGLYIRSEFVNTGAEWEWAPADQFLQHEAQIRGIAGGASRVRFPIIMSGALTPPKSTGRWQPVVAVPEGLLPETPPSAETARQREHLVYAESVLNAGRVGSLIPDDEAVAANPHAVAKAFSTQKLVPEPPLKDAASALVHRPGDHGPMTIRGRAGDQFYVTLDFGRPVHGYPTVTAACDHRVSVDLGYGEIPVSIYSGLRHVRDDGAVHTEGVVGTGYADRLWIQGTETTYEVPDERTCRWLELMIRFQDDTELSLSSVAVVKSQYAIRPKGSFSCGDHEIEKYVQLALTHAEVTMTDAYIDTPGREDGQWDEDLRPRALVSERWFGDARLRRLMLRTHAESQTEAGNFHPFAPSNYPFAAAPFDWSVQWVAALYDEYMWTGDPEVVKRYFPTLERFWQGLLTHLDENGLLATSFMFGDIRVTADMHSYYASGMVTPSIIQRLEWSVVLAHVVGNSEAAHSWGEAAATLRSSYRQHFVVSGDECSPPIRCPALITDVLHHKPGSENDTAPHPAYVDNAHPRGISQASHTFALQIGLLSHEEARNAIDAVFPDPVGSPPPGVVRWNNPSYSGRVLSVLSQFGRSQRAVRHLRERMAPYLPRHPRNPIPIHLQGAQGGPLPEYQVRREDIGLAPIEQGLWDTATPDGTPPVNNAQPSDDTGSHGWAAIPLLWLHEHLLGVHITRPGGGEIRICPDAAGLPFVAGHTMTPKGSVWVMWEPSEYHIEITLPPGVQARVEIPEGFDHERWSVTSALGEAASQHTRQNDGSFSLAEPGTYELGLV